MSSDSSQAADFELQFKKRARRRLVGAIALVLVMLVVLPMVLDDHEHNPPQQAVTISIPSQNAEFTTQAPLNVARPAAAPVVHVPVVENPEPETPVVSDAFHPAAVADSGSSSTATALKEISEKKIIQPQKMVEAKKPEQAKKIEDKKDKSTPESIDKAVNNKTVKAKTNATDKANTTEKQTTEVKESDESGKPYYLQIGVYSDGVNVVQLQKKLSELKLKAYTEKISTDKGDKTRLRVGPFDNKDQADHAAEKVKTIGLSGFVSNK